ncbi:Uncharacterized conserved protein [Phaffia rhodozyma]|uniref:Uncharacterized conserved protein n=1 Tax=Phaffia rhodozyma TaxID=264483 RepID=A0A0F7SPJ5_PHARH|nr:Uncharacterized conserved protein [Phaffia rhodozyma]
MGTTEDVLAICFHIRSQVRAPQLSARQPSRVMSSSVSATLTSATASASSAATSSASGQPASFKIIGLTLAILSGIFIGSSFVIKKKGLLRAQAKSGSIAGEGHAYLKDWVWWIGMTLMVLGEIFNFVAYAFTEALLVTPLGALSVVVCAILSSFFLNESLTFFGWIGCALCIIGSVVIALNSPEQQSVTEIRPFMKLFISPGFLVWSALMILSAVLAILFLVPRYGKSNMLVHIGICSVIGGLSVSCTQGLGASILTSIRGNNQVTFWFFWFLFVFVIGTLLTEINFLNKALELFNTSMVTPTYYVTFTTCTLVTSIILYKGLKASAVQIITIMLGFLVICAGITILQMSKVDPKTLTSLDRKSTILLAAQRPTEDQEKAITGTEEPGVDALRGGFGAIGSIIRARSRRAGSVSSRQTSRGPNGNAGYDPRDPYALSNIPRYQLTDRPPSRTSSADTSVIKEHDYAQPGEQVQIHHSQPPRQGTLRFDPEDTVHRVGRAGHPEEAIHSTQLHSPSVRSPTYHQGIRSNSGGDMSIMSIPEDYPLDAVEFSTRDQRSGYPSLFGPQVSSTPPQIGKFGHFESETFNDNKLPLSPSAMSTSSFSTRDSKSSSAQHVESERVSHRGKDYPHLSKKVEAQTYYADERKGLVDSLSESEDEDGVDKDMESDGSDSLDDLFISAKPKR